MAAMVREWLQHMGQYHLGRDYIGGRVVETHEAEQEHTDIATLD